MDLLEETQSPVMALISFVSIDGVHSARGDPFEECVRLADSSPFVAAVGVNCTPPRFIHNLISVAREVCCRTDV